jgi:hypothetical protein
MKTQRHIEAIARETFRGVNVFYQKKDLEGLRHFVHPLLLEKWKHNWKNFQPQNSSEKCDVKIIQQGTSSFTIQFSTNGFAQVWSFQWVDEKWMLNSTLDSAAVEFKKAS